MAAVAATDLAFFLWADISDRNLQLLVTSLVLVVALLVAALIIALVSRWRRRQEAQEDLSPSAQLAQFRALFEAGTISQEEYERLRALLNPQLRQSLGVPSPSPAAPPPSDTRIQGPPPDDPSTGIRPA